ncbi:MAG: polysaccharide deacetylase family protein [Bacteroidales bacterium]|nr:polysaccharide deacetylase family protein [Bacteroidales bacterium]
MKRQLNSNQIEYVLFHLECHAELLPILREQMQFIEQNTGDHKGIVFPLSKNDLDYEKVIAIDNVPVLFPLSDKSRIYTITDETLVFHHDLLKSAFYLLSGEQELSPAYRDHFGRFPYELSVQYKLRITGIPVVNYYFEWILKAIEEFCRIKNLPFKRKKVFKPFAFNLTHDIDQLDYYTFKKLLYKVKQILGLAKRDMSRTKLLKQITINAYQLMRLSAKSNPAWDFEYLRDREKAHDFTSGFYFLEKSLKNGDSDYSFDDKRLKGLLTYLDKERCELGIHGTVHSAINEEALKRNISNFKKVTPQNIHGIRQHRLIYYQPQTLAVHEACELTYDTTLGFAEYEGFRHSYCLPFKLYNFEEDEMARIWEIPLTMMDATVFYYRRMNPEAILDKTNSLIKEVSKFGGVFTLLWHNGFFDEDRYPGIRKCYEDILAWMDHQRAESINPVEIIKRMENIKKNAR